MAKNIILLSDGTGNSAAKLFKTNVLRIYQALDLSAPAAKNPHQIEQVAYYDDGVGTSSFKPIAALGGAFGFGLKRNVIDLYIFLCRNYRPEDRIYCFGFSRGAFTIRVLTGLVSHQGLVTADSEVELHRRAKGAFESYRRSRYRSGLGWERPVRALQKRMHRPGAARDAGFELEIQFVGLWDTVAAYGLPIDELTRAWNAIFPLSLPDRDPSERMRRACHALALDDERNTFHPVLWNEATLAQDARHTSQERITQVWFAGMHTNVGGGYPDDTLAHVSLDWMMGEAERAGLIFRAGERAKVKATADANGKMYDSRKAMGGLYRYQPRKLALLTHDVDQANNQVLIDRPKIHASVFERMQSGSTAYAPCVLPARYALVTASGDISDAHASQSASVAPEHVSQARNRAIRQEKVWNLIWWRRVVYFCAIGVLVALLAFPSFRGATAACENWGCFLAPVISGAGMLLPSFAAPWVDAYRSHPASFLSLAIALLALVKIGRALRARIRDRMAAIWKPILAAPKAPVSGEPEPRDALYRLRTHSLYQLGFKFLKRIALPALFGIAALLALLAGISQGMFAMMSSAGLVCSPTADAQLRPGRLETGRWPSDALCWASGVRVEEGKRYKLTIAIDQANPWQDGEISGFGVGGFSRDAMRPSMYPGVLIRRHIGAPWFKPIARIGQRGSDEYVLSPRDQSQPDRATHSLVAEITARRNGELFLFVNDAVLPLPAAAQAFYRNNRGIATVRIAPDIEGERERGR